MKVLFLGEFSGVFTNLIPALHKRGIKTFIISTGDGFKGFRSDFNINYKKEYRILWLILLFIGLNGIVNFIRIWKDLKKCISGYDIVQLNNDIPLAGYGWLINIFFFYHVKKLNKKIVLSAWGDHFYIKMYEKRIKKNPFYASMNFIENIKFYGYLFCCRFILSKYVLKHISAITPGSYIYKQAYLWNDKTQDIFPFAILPDCIVDSSIKIKEGEPIKIFHGWQKGREEIKGNRVLDEAIRMVVDKYGDRVQYTIVQNVPYEEYIRMFRDCHIFIDQLYSIDKGINGVLGMAAGKVVFSGLEKEALESYPYYKNNKIGVACYNMTADELFVKICDLIDDPYQIEEISANAIDFVKHNHLNNIVAKKFILLWDKLLENN